MLRRFTALTALFAAAGPALSQEAGPTTVPWAFSSYFGTGWYQVGDDRDAFALRYVYRKRLLEARIDDAGRHPGLEWRLPVTLGFDRFPLDDLAGSLDPGNFASLSVTPGLWLDLPVSERWQLRPFAALGWGAVLDGDDSAFIYQAGVLSRFVFADGPLRPALVQSLGYVGYSPSEGGSEGFWPLLTALEFGHPLVEFGEGDDGLRLVWHVAHTHFHGQLDLRRPDGSLESISEQWEAGLALRRRAGRLDFGWFSLDRLGLAYRFSSDGELEGIGLVVSSLFDQ